MNKKTLNQIIIIKMLVETGLDDANLKMRIKTLYLELKSAGVDIKTRLPLNTILFMLKNPNKFDRPFIIDKMNRFINNFLK